MEADLSTKKQIDFVGQLRHSNNGIAANKSMFRKNERKEIKIFSRKCNNLTKDGKLSIITNAQLNE